MIYITIQGERFPFIPGEEIDLLIEEDEIEKIETGEYVIKNSKGEVVPLGILLYEDETLTIVKADPKKQKVYPCKYIAIVSANMKKLMFYTSILNRFGFATLKIPTIKKMFELIDTEEFDSIAILYDDMKDAGFDLRQYVIVIVENEKEKRISENEGRVTAMYNKKKPSDFRDRMCLLM